MTSRDERGIKKVVHIYVSSGPNLCQLSPDKFFVVHFSILVDTQYSLWSSHRAHVRGIECNQSQGAAQPGVNLDCDRGTLWLVVIVVCLTSQLTDNYTGWDMDLVLCLSVESRVAVLPVRKISHHRLSTAKLANIRCSMMWVSYRSSIWSGLYFYKFSWCLHINAGSDQVSQWWYSYVESITDIFIYLYRLNTKCQPGEYIDLSKIVLCL